MVASLMLLNCDEKHESIPPPHKTDNLMISILDVSPDTKIRNKLKFRIRTNSKYTNVIKVYLDDSLIVTQKDSTLFTVEINTLKLEDGEHKIRTVIVENGFNFTENDMTFQLGNALFYLSAYGLLNDVDSASVIVFDKQGKIVHRSFITRSGGNFVFLYPNQYTNDGIFNLVIAYKGDPISHITSYLNLKRQEKISITSWAETGKNIKVKLLNVPSNAEVILSGLNAVRVKTTSSTYEIPDFSYSYGMSDILVRVEKLSGQFYNSFTMPTEGNMEIDLNQVDKPSVEIVIPNVKNTNARYYLSGIKEVNNKFKEYAVDHFPYVADTMRLKYPADYFQEYKSSIGYSRNNEVFMEIKLGEPLLKLPDYKPIYNISSFALDDFQYTADATVDEFRLTYRHKSKDIELDIIGPATVKNFKLPELGSILDFGLISPKDFVVKKITFWDLDVKEDEGYFKYFREYPFDEDLSHPFYTFDYFNVADKEPIRHRKGWSKIMRTDF